MSCWTVIEPYLYFFTDFYPWFTKFCHLCSFLILVIFIVFVLLIAPSSKLNYPFSHRFYIQCFMQDQNFVNFVNLVIETFSSLLSIQYISELLTKLHVSFTRLLTPVIYSLISFFRSGSFVTSFGRIQAS